MEISWSKAATAWVIGALALTLVLHLVAVAALLTMSWTSAPDTSVPGALHVRGLVLVPLVFNGVLFGLAVIFTLPLQATALRMRCRQASSTVFASVAGLSLVSSIVSFTVLYTLSPLLTLVGSANVYAVGVIGFYVFHVLALTLGRWWAAGRARSARRRDADAAF